jgi:hypothetical protein
VGRVTMAVMDVVDVVAVLDRLVATSLPMLVGMVLVDRVAGELALSPMAIMKSMHVTVVQVVGVVTVLHGGMATAFAVLVWVVLVESMFRCHETRLAYDCIDAQS